MKFLTVKNSNFLMIFPFISKGVSSHTHQHVLCLHRQLCTVLDDDIRGSFANNSGPREYMCVDLLLGKINQLSEKIPHESKSRLCQTDFSSFFYKHPNIQTSPGSRKYFHVIHPPEKQIRKPKKSIRE